MVRLGAKIVKKKEFRESLNGSKEIFFFRFLFLYQDFNSCVIISYAGCIV